MKAKWLVLGIGLLVGSTAANAQYDRYDYPYDNQYDNQYDTYNNRYYYDDDFDWRWDVRVRISDGIRSGRITRIEANRLYSRLENIERREYQFQRDGRYDTWEQDQIWNEIVWLNRQIGMDLRDLDRNFYGYGNIVIGGVFPWYGNSYDFYRFDKRGFGTYRNGYLSRNYRPNFNNRNRIGMNNRNYGNQGYDNRKNENHNNGNYNNGNYQTGRPDRNMSSNDGRFQNSNPVPRVQSPQNGRPDMINRGSSKGMEPNRIEQNGGGQNLGNNSKNNNYEHHNNGGHGKH